MDVTIWYKWSPQPVADTHLKSANHSNVSRIGLLSPQYIRHLHEGKCVPTNSLRNEKIQMSARDQRPAARSLTEDLADDPCDESAEIEYLLWSVE